MRFKNIWLSFILACFTPSLACAQSEPRLPAETIEFAGQDWRVTARNADITTHKGREALALTRGRVWADTANFQDGVISFDVAYREHQVFIGAGWRADTVSRAEEMYFRGHLNNKPDALQYTPVENRLSAWQIFSDVNSIGPVSQTYDDWNQVKIVVKGDRADIYFNSETPVLHIPDLKADLDAGAVMLRSTGRQAETVYFSNVVIRPLNAGEDVIGHPKPAPAPPEGRIVDWQVSSAFSEDTVSASLSLTAAHTNGLTWKTLGAETNGILNLAKTAKKTDAADTVFVRLNLRADRAQMKELTFGYSDRARIYLNGKRLYFGNAGWRVRDYRFLGTVGFFDSVGLDLKAGDNELLIAVSETFGGWAWAGAIENWDGLFAN